MTSSKITRLATQYESDHFSVYILRDCVTATEPQLTDFVPQAYEMLFLFERRSILFLVSPYPAYPADSRPSQLNF